jgi:multiple sugar transport system ATP-binding protein
MTMADRIAVMNKGLLQQIDTPQNLYDFPANLFVAGFIGSPAMNFFPAKLVKSNGNLYVDGGTFQVQVPEKRVGAYMSHEGKPVIFGIRPEDIHNPDFAPPGIIAQPVPAKVDVTELMGNEINVYLKTGNNNFVARVDPRSRYAIDNDVQMVFNMDNIHVFDKDTEQAVR